MARPLLPLGRIVFYLIFFSVSLNSFSLRCSAESSSAIDRATALWKNAGLDLATVRVQAGSARGSGFLISHNYVITAKHIVCDDENLRLPGILLTTGAGEITAPEDVTCDLKNDVAVIKLPGGPWLRHVLHAASAADAIRDPEHFVSLFTYSASEDGDFDEGTATDEQTDDGLFRADIPNISGDSGAPIIDCRGDVIAVNVDGDGGKADAVPLSLIDSKDQAEAGFSVPPPVQNGNGHGVTSCPTIGDIDSNISKKKRLAIFGNVWLLPLRVPGQDTTIPVRPGEVQVDVTVGDEVMQTSVDSDGSYSVLLPQFGGSTLPRVIIRPTTVNTGDPLVPMIVTLPEPVDASLIGDRHDLFLYVRGRYAADEKIAADSDFLNAVDSMPVCFRAGGTVTSYVDCARQNQTNVAFTSLYHSEDEYNKALEYADDPDLRASIASRLMSLQTQAGRPCDAVDTVTDLHENEAAMGPITVSLLIQDVLGCQYDVLQSAVNPPVMSWRSPDQTTQEASVGLITKILSPFADKPDLDRQHQEILSDALTSLEMYKKNDSTTPINIETAAKTIFVSESLRKSMSNIDLWAHRWCKRAPTRLTSQIAVIHGLGYLSNCRG